MQTTINSLALCIQSNSRDLWMWSSITIQDPPLIIYWPGCKYPEPLSRASLQTASKNWYMYMYYQPLVCYNHNKQNRYRKLYMCIQQWEIHYWFWVNTCIRHTIVCINNTNVLNASVLVQRSTKSTQTTHATASTLTQFWCWPDLILMYSGSLVGNQCTLSRAYQKEYLTPYKWCFPRTTSQVCDEYTYNLF